MSYVVLNPSVVKLPSIYVELAKMKNCSAQAEIFPSLTWKNPSHLLGLKILTHF